MSHEPPAQPSFSKPPINSGEGAQKELEQHLQSVHSTIQSHSEKKVESSDSESRDAIAGRSQSSKVRYVQADPTYRQPAKQPADRPQPKSHSRPAGLVVTDLLKLRMALDQAHDLPNACQVLAENLGNLFDCNNVFVSLNQKGSLRLLGYEHEDSLEFEEGSILSAQHEVFQPVASQKESKRNSVEETENEHRDDNETVEEVDSRRAGWPKSDQWNTSLVHRKLVSEHHPAAASFAMITVNKELLGVVTVVGNPSSCVSMCEKINHITELVAPHFRLRQRASESIVSRLKRSAASKFLFSLKWLLLGSLLLALFFIRIPHRIQCDTEAKPVVRRYVSAPFDSVLKASAVRSGDSIDKDQSLAFLDEDEIRLQMSSAEAEKEKYRKLKSSALAKGDTLAMQQAQLEFRRLTYRNKLLFQRSQNLEISSPISGVVLRNELEDAEGAPLKQGQVLFEIAPLDQMIFCVYISQQDIAYVEQGMTVQVTMEGTRKSFEGTIRRIRPQAVTFENESVFVAEVNFENLEESVRPGMRGYATVVSQKQSLGWILFRKPFAYLKKMSGF